MGLFKAGSEMLFVYHLCDDVIASVVPTSKLL